jgi:septal ring factor EnvC (AmiA/AmiB activator)
MEKIAGNRLFLVSFAFILLFALPFCSATLTNFSCSEDIECWSALPEQDYSFCDLSHSSCVIIDDSYFSQSKTNSLSVSTNTIKVTDISNSSKNTTLKPVDLTNVTKEISSLTQKISGMETTYYDLQQQIEALNAKATEIETINAQLSQLNSGIEELNLQLQQLSQQQAQTEQQLGGQINSVSTGLATLQTNISSTNSELTNVKTELSTKSIVLNIVTYIVILMIIVSLAIILSYYLTHKRRLVEKYQQDLTPEIYRNIEQQIKSGKSISHLSSQLKKQGWDDAQINWAYKEVSSKIIPSTSNSLQNESKSTNTYSQPQRIPSQETKKVAPFSVHNTASSSKLEHKMHYNDVVKVMVILTISLVVVLAILLLIRGSTGQAYFQDNFQLTAEAQTLLEKRIQNNTFYPAIKNVNLCVQIVDGNNIASFRIVKGATGHKIIPLETPCDHYPTRYDFSVKFVNWNSFVAAVNKMDCTSLQRLNVPNKNVLILPSRYILDGFKLNPDKDASAYCEAISQCLDAGQLSDIGLVC